RVALRRVAAKEQTNDHMLLVNSDISIVPRSHTVYKQGREIRLKPKEYQLLLLLSQHKNRVFTRDEVLDLVWGMDYYGDDRTVDVNVRRLRKKLDQPNTPSIIETVFGVGYKMRG